MEARNFKSVAFGGFDKEEVIQYIQKTAQENTEALETLRRENGSLRAENESLRAQMEQSLREREDAAKKETEALREQARALTAELDELRPQAQSYREVRSQVGDIECQARRRASELESATTMRLNALIADVRRQYQEMSSAFSATAGQAAAELRKIEVSLTQLPRAMDQTGKKLEEIVSAVDNQKK